jgi:predicted Zn finger-like uncharacterized protein
MQFACENCSTRYAVPDDKIAGKRVRTRCRTCGAEILIEGRPSSPPTAGGGSAVPNRQRAERLTGSAFTTDPTGAQFAQAARRVPTTRATPVARDDGQWTVALGPNDRRKMTTPEIVEAYAAGSVSSLTPIWKDGMDRWQPPFDIPAIALALTARGLSANKDDSDGAPVSLGRFESSPPGPPTPAAVRAPRLRVDDVRKTAPATPSTVARPPSGKAPTGESGAPGTPRRVIPRPMRSGAPGASAPATSKDGRAASLAPRRSLTPGPVPEEAWQEDEEEATHVVADKEPSKENRGSPGEDGPPITVRGNDAPDDGDGSGVPSSGNAIPVLDRATSSAPPGAGEFEFENETTAVIAPDKARALLEAEAARESSGAESSRDPAKQTKRLDFIFDDEATEIIAPERASALLSDPEAAAALAREVQASQSGDVPTAPPLSPYPAAPTPAAGTPPPPPAAGQPASGSAPPPPPPKLSPYPGSVPVGPGEGTEPSVVVRDARRIRPIDDDMTRTLPPKVTRELGDIQHEKTRLVRVTQRKPSGTGMSFWVVLVLALTAAATGGFLASQLIQRHGAPGWFKSK